ncbi:MAG TPA: hypothetical protein VGC75_02850 [Candidatus Nitrosocosmicus sp.]|jgi:hypothetical protein
MQTSRKIAAEITVSIAFILLAVYIADAGIARLNNDHGFLPLSAKDRGMFFGGISIILFFISYGIGFNIKSRILTILLVVGGALMGTSVLISTLMPENSKLPSNSPMSQIISPQFLGIIVIGYIIMGLGILRGLRKK